LPADGDPLDYAGRLTADGRPEEAVRLLRERIDAGRGGLLARALLTRALLATHDAPAALEVARETALLYPQVAEAVLALGEALMAMGHLPTAIAEFQRALRLDPESGAARLQLGRAWLEAGEPERALENFEMLDTEFSGRDEGIARAHRMRQQLRSDPGYVRHLFDQFSAEYDARMRQQLRYQAPEILRALADLVIAGAKDLLILDLGCGTGLAAEAFADLASAIDGIDLSPEMIAKARARGLYRCLSVADIETALAEGSTDYDLILAADTLVYLGDLAPALDGVLRRLRPGGSFLFTVERSAGPDFALGPKRRWQHSELYLRAAAATAGLELAGLVACAPRTEANAPVDGFAVAVRKPV
jgi:predicted TPR repeat methyltransferase